MLMPSELVVVGMRFANLPPVTSCTFVQCNGDALRATSLALSDQFIAEVEAACPDLHLATPRDPQVRGSQVSFRHPEGYAIMQALIAQGVVGDFRAPDIMRFGFTPLFIDASDVSRAVGILGDIMRDGTWDQAQFKTRAAVT